MPQANNSKGRSAGVILIIASLLASSALVPVAVVRGAAAEQGFLDPSCVSYDSARSSLDILCGTATITQIHDVLGREEILSEVSDGVWHLQADLVVRDGAHLAITGADTSWLRLESPHGIISYGDLVIDSTKITSWDASANNYAATDGKRPRSFITAWDFGTGQLNITNSEIAYLGYYATHRQGLAYYSGHGSIVENNDIHHMWYGFYSNNVTGIDIENNKVHDNVIYGLDPHTGTRNMNIRNNVVYNITKGIGIICSYDCDNILMENNVVHDVDVVGLMLSRNSVNSVIRNNIVYNSGTNGGGISVDASSNNKVYNNTVSVGRFGIKVSANSDNNEVFNNTISDYSSYGICMIDGSDANSVHGNKIGDVGEYGICAMRGSSDNLSYNNQIAGAGFYGLYVRDGDAVGNQFRNNYVKNSSQNGVRIFNNTSTTFLANTVLSSTKADYSVAGGTMSIIDSTFTSSYFEGAGVDMPNLVTISNSDGRLVAADSKVSDIVGPDGKSSIQFVLKNGERVVLNTLPFAAAPETGTLEVSFTGGTVLQDLSPQLAWTERVSSQAETKVSHRITGLRPGLDLTLTSSDNKWNNRSIIGSDGVLEFISIQEPGSGTDYSLLPSNVASLGKGSEILDKFDSSANNTTVRTFGCQIYSSVVHCDPTRGQFTSYTVEGEFTNIQPLTSPNPAFVAGKVGDALKLSARYRESVEVMNGPQFANGNFTIAFWIQNTDEAEPYGHIVSHVNFAGTAGWFIDMTSTSRQPYDQKLQFRVTNSQAQLVSAPEADIPQGRFVHVAGVFDGTSVKLYLDGAESGEAPYRGMYIADSGTPLRIGSASYSTSTHRWSGIIDDVVLFDRALSSSEVSALAQGLPVDSQPGLQPLAHWAFDNDVRDSSGGGSDGDMSTLLTSMAFAPDGRLFFTEKNTGYIKILKDNVILPEPFAFLPNVYVSWEQGLLGITLDPQFEQNGYLYQYYTYMDPATGEVYNRVVRFTDVGNKGTDMKVLLDRIPAVRGYHSGGALAFGLDDKLYITVGDATEHSFAQDPNILIGKVLRMNSDGTIPEDNPDPGSLVYTRGHRNMFGLAFDGNGTGIITENGEAAYDEINVIEKGGNYGFPTFQPANTPPELADPSTSILPARSYFETVAPTQALFYRGSKIPLFEGRFLFGTFTGDIFAVKIDPATKQVIAEDRIELHPSLFTPVIGLAQDPAGDLYYGSYGIFRLDGVDLATRTPASYPIRVAMSDDVTINNLKFDQDGRRVIIDASAGGPDPAGQPGEPKHTVSMMIPRILMDQITGVVSGVDASPLDFRLISQGGSSLDGYNVITIGFSGQEGSNMSVIAARVIPEFGPAAAPLLPAIAILAVIAVMARLRISGNQERHR